MSSPDILLWCFANRPSLTFKAWTSIIVVWEAGRRFGRWDQGGSCRVGISYRPLPFPHRICRQIPPPRADSFNVHGRTVRHVFHINDAFLTLIVLCSENKYSLGSIPYWECFWNLLRWQRSDHANFPFFRCRALTEYAAPPTYRPCAYTRRCPARFPPPPVTTFWLCPGSLDAATTSETSFVKFGLTAFFMTGIWYRRYPFSVTSCFKSWNSLSKA